MLPDTGIDYKAEYDALLEQLKWTHAIVGVLVELEGGAVEIPQETLETYDLDNSLEVVFNPETLVYTIQQTVSDVTA